MAKNKLPDWLTKSHKVTTTAETLGIPVLPDFGIETGLIYMTSGPTGLGGTSPCSEKVLVTAIHPEKNYVEICLIHLDTAMATGSDLVLDSGDTGMIYELVLQADVVGVVWMDQLRKRLGRVQPEILELLPKLATGKYPEGYGPKVGLPLRGNSDPRWSFKEAQVDVLQSISWDCTETLLDGRDYLSKWINAEAAKFVQLDRENGHTNLITIPEAYLPGTPICGTTVPDPIEQDQSTWILDTSIIDDADLLDDSDRAKQILDLLENSKVALSPAWIKANVDPAADDIPTPGPEFLRSLEGSKNKDAWTAVLLRAAPRPQPTKTASKSAPLNIAVVERDEEVLIAA